MSVWSAGLMPSLREMAKSVVPPQVRDAILAGRDLVTLRASRRAVEWRMRHRARNPVTFNDRLLFKMVHDRRPLLTELADKVLVRDFVASTVGSEYVCECLCLGTSPEEIPWELLPHEYVVKVNHGSGGIVMVTEDADEDASLPRVGSRVGWDRFRVRPSRADPLRIADLCRHWLNLDYSWARGRSTVQWCYADINRRLMVEELLRDARGQHPREYRLFVINGSVAFAQVELDQFGDHTTAVMSPAWEMLPVRLVDPAPTTAPSKPEHLPVMIELAERLARPLVDFVRVDFYDLTHRLVVGEMTHYPSGGQAPISPPEFAYLWGKGWVHPY